MTVDEAQKLNVGDRVRLRQDAGRVAQTCRRWFMVSWDGKDTPEIIWRCRQTILLTRLEREA
jgi:hypothetical protein